MNFLILDLNGARWELPSLSEYEYECILYVSLRSTIRDNRTTGEIVDVLPEGYSFYRGFLDAAQLFIPIIEGRAILLQYGVKK